MFLARKSDTLAMDRVLANDVQNLGIFFTARSEGPSASWHVVEEIFDLCIISLVTTTTLSVLLAVI